MLFLIFFFLLAQRQLPNGWRGGVVLPLKGGWFYCKVLLTSVKLLTSCLKRMPREEGRWQISGGELLVSRQHSKITSQPCFRERR